ncbi:MAG: class I SAM-dependent methyltransferase [Gammaproteobacteria bacterium]|nr:class I SAM-dependent methyltransferase [Gammaproteobacteria bacterium]
MRLPGFDALVRQAEAGRVPDALLRLGIRQLIRSRLRQESAGDKARRAVRQRDILRQLERGAIAEHTATANAQHYDMPPGFFGQVLGPRLKYSACLWPAGTTTLAQAEERMLELYAERAGLTDGMRVLDLGCGWGSFALWLAERHPASHIVAVSNSAEQRRCIAARAATAGLTNVEARTVDVNEFVPDERFDRIVSVEMFEHMRNYAELMRRVSSWLVADGALFVHIFCHRSLAYPFEAEGRGDWMARHFFTGGVMPARDTLAHFQEHMRLTRTWEASGSHYQRTARAWLDNLDRNREAAGKALSMALPPGSECDGAPVQLQRWRMFFMACEELFGWNGGNEWLVCHYRFQPRRTANR